MKKDELAKAAAAWFEYRGYTVQSTKQVGCTEAGITAFDIVVDKGGLITKMLVMQHRCFFSPADVTGPGYFIFPANDVCKESAIDADDGRRAILLFNDCRAYAVFVQAGFWMSATFLDDGRFVLHADDLNVIDVPWRLWAMDNLPEWLQRGWPNPVDGYAGTPGDRSTWQFHSCWSVDVLKAAEHYSKLPTKPDEAPNFDDWRAKGYYRAWLEELDDAVLPWYEEPADEPIAAVAIGTADVKFNQRVSDAIDEIRKIGITPIHEIFLPDGAPSSREAAGKIEVRITQLEAIALTIIRSYTTNGCIHDDVEAEFMRRFAKHKNGKSDMSARYPALERKGLIVRPGEKRKGSNPKSRGQLVMYGSEFSAVNSARKQAETT